MEWIQKRKEGHVKFFMFFTVVDIPGHLSKHDTLQAHGKKCDARVYSLLCFDAYCMFSIRNAVLYLSLEFR